MYTPPYYKNEDLNEIKEFIRQNSFGILVNQVEGKPWATHIPLEFQSLEGKDFLVGHIAKANPQWKSFQDKSEVLCIFNGPHAYVSSSWYKKEEVPTWDYIAAHVYGSLRVLTEEETMASLNRLVNRYEADSEDPIKLEKLSPKTLRQVKGVVGFQIEITDIQATYKLSQTRPEDHEVIIKNLKKGDVTSAEVARHIEKHSNN